MLIPMLKHVQKTVRQPQEWYRRNFSKGLRSFKKLIIEGDLFLVREEYFSKKKLKSSLVAEDPYCFPVATRTIVTIKVEEKVKHTPRDRVVKAPDPSTHMRRQFLDGAIVPKAKEGAELGGSVHVVKEWEGPTGNSPIDEKVAESYYIIDRMINHVSS